MSVNPNLVVWLSDVHVSEIDPPTATGRLSREEALQITHHVNSLEPYAVFNLGDLGDHHGEQQDYVNYKNYMHNRFRRPYYAIRGNHDKDQDTGTADTTGYSVFDGVFPALPYHVVFDWPAPQVRFILFHADIINTGGLEGFFSVSASEQAWIDEQLTAVPVGWKCFVCSHPPRLNAFGNNIHDDEGGTELDVILAAHSSKILGYLNGHRHEICGTGVDAAGITHVNGSSVSKTTGADAGGFMLLVYDPSVPNIRLHFREATNNAVPRCDFGVAGATSYTKATFAL